MNILKQFSITKSELVSSTLIFLIIIGVVLGSRLVRLTSESVLEFDKQTEIIIEESANIDSIVSELASKSIEIDEDELLWASKILGWRTFQRGRYEFEGNYSYGTFLSKMARGIQDPVPLVILPGTNPQYLSNYIAEKMHFDSEDFLNALTDTAFLKEKNLSKEELFGRMFPETYLIYWTSSPKDVIQRALRQFNNSVVKPLEGRATELDITLSEALTMASIVEWEANLEEEKPIISGLYWNRLEKGMRLQADPTVNYAVGERRRLLFEDYELEHPFNTYEIDGLPPGPITNPSLNTIKATLYPADHQYLYMVASPDGGHTFTSTFAEHRAESDKWRKWIRQQYRLKQQQEAAEANEGL